MEASLTEDRMTGRPTGRSIAKASRRSALLDAASRLFAARGYNGVSIEDLGAAAGVSGPAVYRHFSGKHAVLSALLTGVSDDLLHGGRHVAETSPTPADALASLIGFQVDFALGNPDVIRVQDRDLASLAEEDERIVRSLQRSYVEVWVDQLAAYRPATDRSLLRRRVHAVFGLINSTPHTTRGSGTAGELDQLRAMLRDMAWAALTVGATVASDAQPDESPTA